MKFKPKSIVVTQGIASSIETGELTNEDLDKALLKHFNNEGEECEEDKESNEEAIREKFGRVLSVFTIRGEKIYIITEGLDLEGTGEYPLTTILLPLEY